MNYAPEAFQVFVTENLDDVQLVQSLLNVTLSDNPVSLTTELREIESMYGRVMTILADANAFLDVSESAALLPKGSGSELDRKIAMTAACAEQRAFRDKMDGLGKAINLRLMLGTSLMKHHQNEMRSLGSKVGQ